MPYQNFVSLIHKSTTRDYLSRVTSRDKAEVAEQAVKWGFDYWDGDRETGYGGYRYDGRWKTVAEEMVDKYKLRPKMRVLDVGCGKGFLLHDLAECVPGLEVYGIDVSQYALEHAMESVKENCYAGHAKKLPWDDNYFDLVISINTLHNLHIPDLWSAIREINRVGKKYSYICVEAYRNEREKVNLMYWQLTCRIFNTPKDWEFIFSELQYNGDFEFIYFE